jgi:hypothetical protein
MYGREFLKTAASCLGAFGFAEGSSGAQVSGVGAGSSKAAPAGASGVDLNQIGFLPDSPKVATISARAKSSLLRSLKENSVAFRSPLSAQCLDNASGDTAPDQGSFRKRGFPSKKRYEKNEIAFTVFSSGCRHLRTVLAGVSAAIEPRSIGEGARSA